jgi:hypothetical protein
MCAPGTHQVLRDKGRDVDIFECITRQTVGTAVFCVKGEFTNESGCDHQQNMSVY